MMPSVKTRTTSHDTTCGKRPLPDGYSLSLLNVDQIAWTPLLIACTALIHLFAKADDKGATCKSNDADNDKYEWCKSRDCATRR